MASISSTGRSSINSIYGTRNVISGLASGMDTESMIENAVSGYKTKIDSLNQKRTRTEWQQEAYRSIVTKMAAFTGKYADYQSSTNLMSASFFNRAVQTVSQGANASKVTASGKTSSDIQINAVKQLAKAATYRVSGGQVGKAASADGSVSGGKFDLDADQTVSTVSGTLTLAYGGTGARSYLDISFGELENFGSAQEMVDSINRQLADQTITTSSGTTKKASEMVRAKVENGEIVFEDASGAGNELYIHSVTGKLKDTLGVSTGSGVSSINVDGKDLTTTANTAEYLSHATMKITLDGVTKTIKMPGAEDVDKYAADNGKSRDEAYIDLIQKNIDDAFGKMRDKDGNEVSKLKVSDAGGYGDSEIQLRFASGQKGSTFSVTSDKAKAMGLSDAGLTSYFNTTQTLKDLLGEDGLAGLDNGKTDKDGNPLYDFEINGVKIGSFTADTSLASIMSQINGNKEAGVNVSYSKTTNEFTFTAKDSGVAGRIEFGGGVAQKLFGDTSAGVNAGGEGTKTELANGGTYTKGQDAVFSATINGGEELELTRSSNTVEMDGLTFTLKGEFGYKKDADGNFVMDAGKPVRDTAAEAVTFASNADADKIVDAIKSMVEDYNAMVTEIKEAYSTLPVQRSNGAYYQPLTDDDKADMSESAIEAWEKNAKTGILFGDQDLSTLYSRLTSAISMYGQDAADLKAAGITVNYSNGLTTLAFDENKLRATLETDPDRVADIFTKSTENGASSKGFLQALKEPLDLYGKTTGVNLSTGSKGVLVGKAGHPLAPSSMYNNTIQEQLDRIDQEIEKWQDKMSDKVDYYTTQFSKLEQLVAQMNSQSSTLAGLMGGN